MKKFSLFLVPVLIFFTSCQKEISWDTPTDPGGGGTDTLPDNNSGELLVKSVSVTNGETTTTTYSYTTDGKIDVINMTGTSGGVSVGNYRKFYRDAAGRIIRIAQKVPPQGGIETDTINMYVHYANATTFNYDYTVQNIKVDVYEINDSTVYTYNSNNQITEAYTYETSTIFGPFQEIKLLYSYDAAGNVIRMELYDDASGSMQLTSTWDIQYDAKTNPLAFDQQASLLSGGAFGSSANNPVVIKFTDPLNPDVQTITNTYTFGANGLPEKLVSDDDFDGAITTTTTTFYYE